MPIQGLLTALVTPFRDGALDETTFRALVRRQIDEGVDGIVPVGTTGEAPTLPIDEHIQVVRWAVEEAKGRVPVVAGIGSNSTASAISTGHKVLEAGADAVLATAPYYNKPTQEGLYQHFKAIAEALPTEICLYDVPGRSIVRLLPPLVERLSHIDNITAIKDATADLANGIEVMRRCGDRIAVLSGDDFTAVPLILMGGVGTISVASNVTPALMAQLIGAALAGRLPEARSLNARLAPLYEALFLESNPAPTKAAMAAMGLLHDELRLPLVPMTDAPRQRLLGVLRDLGQL